MIEERPNRPDPEQQDPESSAAASAPPPNEEQGDDPQEGPSTEKLDQDPAYEPGESGLGRLKGG